jgi:hypothetical protein
MIHESSVFGVARVRHAPTDSVAQDVRFYVSGTHSRRFFFPKMRNFAFLTERT